MSGKENAAKSRIEPTNWKRFVDSVEENGGWEEERNQAFSRFAARFGFASSVSITNPNLTDQTAEGYADILRVALSYSALEALEKAFEEYEGNQDRKVSVYSPEVAELFRSESAERLRKSFQSHLTGEKLRTSLKELAESGQDVRPLAQATRHLAFHGTMSPGTAGYRKGVGEMFKLLAAEVLGQTDKNFSDWLDGIGY